MSIRRAKSRSSRRAVAACVGISFLLSAPLVSAQDHQDIADASPVDASTHTEIVRRADALREQLRAKSLPNAEPIALSSTRALTDRMIDAEVRFDLEEWVHCASLLAPVLPDLRAQSHPAYERALYLFAESLYQSQSNALARSAFQRLLDESQPTYRKEAMMRLLEIEIAVGTRRSLEERYKALLQAYGSSGDAEVYYLLARTQYFQRNYSEAVQGFGRLGPESPLYWRAQYHAGVALAREGQIERALERFVSIEKSLKSRTDLSSEDYEVLQYARLGQGVAHFELEAWEAAGESYARVAPDSLAYPQSLYQLAWSEIRNDKIDDALAHLDMLELASNNTRLISEARLLSADLLRKERNYTGALDAFGRASDDLELVRLELRDIEVQQDQSVPKRVDQTAEILTGSMLARFDAAHWFPDDPVAQRGLELLRASETLVDWLDVNQDIADEIRDALASGFAYDRALALRDARDEFVQAQAQSARWWGELAKSARAQRGVTDESYITDAAEKSYRELPAANLHDNVSKVRSLYEQQELNLFREEQELLAQLDAIDARLKAIRQQLQLQKIDAESVGQERQELQKSRSETQAQVNALRDARAVVQRQRVRYGVGEAQTVVLTRSRTYIDAAKDELRAMGVDVSQPSRALESLDDTIDAGLHALDDRVKSAWRQAYNQLDDEQSNVDRLYASRRDFDANEMKEARAAATDGFMAMLGNVKNVALRASLGEVDVAWWQKEDVSQRIDSLFKEQERQIQRLDAGFSELRE